MAALATDVQSAAIFDTSVVVAITVDAWERIDAASVILAAGFTGSSVKAIAEIFAAVSASVLIASYNFV